MEPRSNVAFTSNIYVFKSEPKGPLIDSREFLDAISDPEALDILWDHGLRAEKLNALQRKQHEKVRHCVYAEKGDFPWGTPVGGRYVVCLCSNTWCSEYSKCAKFHPIGFKPQPRQYPSGDTSPDRSKHPEAENKSSSRALTNVHMVNAEEYERRRNADKKPSRGRRTAVQERGGQAKRPVKTRVNRTQREPVARQKGEKFGYNGRAKWTKEEDQLIREFYPIIGENVDSWKWYLPGRDFAEILTRARELNLYQKKSRVAQTQTRTTVKKPKRKAVKKDPEKEAEMERHRQMMRARPWEADEDAIIRRCYGKYGADMTKWPEKLKYRTKPSIVARSKELGL